MKRKPDWCCKFIYFFLCMLTGCVFIQEGATHFLQSVLNIATLFNIFCLAVLNLYFDTCDSLMDEQLQQRHCVNMLIHSHILLYEIGFNQTWTHSCHIF
jgi:hypothetical protein